MQKKVYIAYCMSTLQISLGIMKVGQHETESAYTRNSHTRKVRIPESLYTRKCISPKFSYTGGTQKFIVFKSMKQASVPTGTSRYIIIISTLFEETTSIFPVLQVDLLRGGSTPLKITWVRQRQLHRVQERARERMLSLALTVVCRLRSPYGFRRIQTLQRSRSISSQFLESKQTFPQFQASRSIASQITGSRSLAPQFSMSRSISRYF